MSKRQNWILLLVCALIAFGVSLSALHQREPSYQGRTLSQWLDAIQQRGVQTDSEKDPIRAIGTNAIPTILKWISYESSPSRKRIDTLIERLSSGVVRHFSHAEQRSQRAVFVFDVLGSEARMAIPELTRLALNSSDTNCAARCIEALACIGPTALPTVLNFATNSPPITREIAIITLPNFQNPTAIVSVIMHDLANDNAEALGLVGDTLDLSNRYAVFSLLTNALHSPSVQVRARAVRSIDSLRLFPSDVEPVFLPLLVDPEYKVREMATNALRQSAQAGAMGKVQ